MCSDGTKLKGCGSTVDTPANSDPNDGFGFGFSDGAAFLMAGPRSDYDTGYGCGQHGDLDGAGDGV